MGCFELNKKIEIKPLTAEAFAPFGDVLECHSDKIRLINGGTTERHHALGYVEANGDGARVALNIFKGQPREFPYLVTMMERHPFGSQSFTPLSGEPFLVIVATDENGKPSEPIAFLAQAHQGVNYRCNTWHHPLMSLEKVCDFLVVDRDGQGNNLEEYFYENAYVIKEPSL